MVLRMLGLALSLGTMLAAISMGILKRGRAR